MNRSFLNIFKRVYFEYTPLNHENIDIRINITVSLCLISIKLFSQSLFKRDYDPESNLGSLRSTIAGAMIYKITKGLKIKRL
jgi:23S rRNA G2445 N2-methylase RlmL